MVAGREGRCEQRHDADHRTAPAVADAHRPPVRRRDVHAETRDHELNMRRRGALSVEHRARRHLQPRGIRGQPGDYVDRQRAEMRGGNRGASSAVECTAWRRGELGHPSGKAKAPEPLLAPQGQVSVAERDEGSSCASLATPHIERGGRAASLPVILDSRCRSRRSAVIQQGQVFKLKARAGRMAGRCCRARRRHDDLVPR
jgi:hypothetical protein